MTATATSPIRVADARELARALLGEGSDRWWHTSGVAARAAELATTVPEADRDTLVAAAWLHDIGYAELARDTGFHPLDGARYLDRRHWPGRVNALVAHHSGAWFVAHLCGLAGALAAYRDERSAVTDALAYADQTVGPRGQRLTLRERMADMLCRHGPDSPNALVHHVRQPYLVAVADRVERRLAGLEATGSRGAARGAPAHSGQGATVV
jgi:putative nucleotidyltransferase with HDIG domain